MPWSRSLFAYAAGGFGLSFNAMTAFLVPLRADELGVPLSLIGILLGAKALSEALLSVPLGGLIDRLGPKRAFLAGTTGTAVIALGFSLASSGWALLVLQFMLGAVRALGWVSSQALASSLGSSSQRATHTARFSFVATSGQIVAPLLVGVAAQAYGFQRAFLVLAVVAAGFACLGLFLPRATAGAASTTSSFRAAAALLRRPAMQVAMLLTFSRLWAPTTWSGFFPLFLVQNGVSPPRAASVLSAMAVVATLVGLSAGRLSRLAAPELLTAGALGLGTLGLGVSPLFLSASLAYVPAVLLGIGQGLSLPLLLVIASEAAPSSQRGLSLGMRSSANQTAATLSPLAAGPLVDGLGLSLGFGVSAVLGGLVLVAAAARHLMSSDSPEPPTAAAVRTLP